MSGAQMVMRGCLVLSLLSTGFSLGYAVRSAQTPARVAAPAAEAPAVLPGGIVLLTGCAGNAPSVLVQLENGRQECRQLVGGTR